MKRINKRRIGVVMLTGAALLSSGDVIAQSVPPAMSAPSRNITAPGAQRPGNPPSQPQKQSPAARAPQPILQSPGAGTIEGFVYWDANKVVHIPASSCSGLAITVSVGSNSGGPLTAYSPIGTLTNNFKYVGQVKQFVAGGKVNVYDVCTFGYGKVPVGPNLQVKVAVTDPTAFSPSASPQIAILGPIQIVNGQCNMLPRITNPQASDLFAHWGSCQDMAFNVNFAMQAPNAANTSGVASMPVMSNAQTGMLSGAQQKGLLANGTTQNLQSPASPTAISGNHQSAAGQSGGAQSPARKVELNPQPLPPRVQMANADVLKMLKGRVPESVILAQIQSSTHKFDFSPTGCRQLQDARASRQLLDAMADGSVHPCSSISGNAGSAAHSKLAVVRLDAPKALKKASNPRLAQQNSEIIAVLEKQHQAATQESSEMKVSLRPASSSASLTRVPAANGFKGGTTVQAIGPEKTQGAQGGISSAITHAPFLNNVVLTCTNDPTPRILRVGGGQGPGVFTPEAKYNLYSIVGCSFGQSQSGNSAYIFGLNGFKANLNIDFWSENGITVHLDPYLAGVLDQNNVTLVVSPAGKQQIQLPGMRFYAARGMPGSDGSDQEVQLAYNSLPQSSVTLAYTTSPVVIGWNQVPSNAKSQFPSFSFSGTPVVNWVFRYAYGHSDPSNPCFINDVHYGLDTCQWYFSQNHAGIDHWDFSKLAPGFAISSYNLYYETTDPSTMCGSWDDEASGDKDGLAGEWNFDLDTKNLISVTWPIYYCHDREEFGSRVNKQVLSSYGLAVWVMGPRCVDPWSGRQDQNCMSQLKQILN
jgi:hypothetical protein